MAQGKEDLGYMTIKLKKESQKSGLTFYFNKQKYLCRGKKGTDGRGIK